MPRPKDPNALTKAERAKRDRFKRGGTVTLTAQGRTDLESLRAAMPGFTSMRIIEMLLREAAGRL